MASQELYDMDKYMTRRMNEVFGPDLAGFFSMDTDFPELTTSLITAAPEQKSQGRRSRRERRFPFKVDISEIKDAYFVKAELPGLKKEEIKVHCDENNVLTIEGELTEEKVDETEVKHLSERNLGKLVRHVRLPRNADPNSVQTGFVNGLLCIKFGKKIEERGRPITIQ